MSTNELHPKQLAGIIAALLLVVAALVTVGMFLLEYGPGNMGRGFFGGAGVATLGILIAWWRVQRRPGSTTTLERAWTLTGDERDDAVLTRALAVVGLSAPLIVAAATILLAVEVPMLPVLAILNFVLIGIFVIAFAVINRRS